jgi:hypothetical protein
METETWKFLDAKNFPIIFFHFPPQATDASVELWMEDWRKILLKKVPFAFISDTRPVREPLTPLQRKLIADFYVSHEAALRMLCKAGASIMTSSINKGVALAISWLRPPPYPRKEFGDLESAQRWVEEKLRGA